MELTQEIKPTECLLRAFRFVVAHRWPCLLRAVPIALLTALIAWLETNILANAEFFALVMNELLYATFAVYWHRYTVLETERLRDGFGLFFGLREIKFAAAMLSFVIASYLLELAFLGALGIQTTSRLVVFSVFLLLAFLPFLLVFPAIALDQPVRLDLLARRIFEMFLPLIGTIILGSVAAGGIYLLIFLPAVLLTIVTGSNIPVILISSIVTFLVTPFILAVSVSFVSILFRETVGIMRPSVP